MHYLFAYNGNFALKFVAYFCVVGFWFTACDTGFAVVLVFPPGY